MRERVFVDTFGFIAAINPDDQHHEAVAEVIREVERPQFWTTDWVLIETADGCSEEPRFRIRPMPFDGAFRHESNMASIRCHLLCTA